jgi:hypothetical protein
MGRPRKQIDETALLAMRGEGKKLQEISKEMCVSARILSRRLAILHHQRGILTKYRELQGLQLSALQARMLEAVDARGFEKASLIELLTAFNVLKKAELIIQRKGHCEVWGLLDHLQALEGLE